MPGLSVDVVKMVMSGTINAVQDWSCSLWLAVELSGGAWGVANQNGFTANLDTLVTALGSGAVGQFTATTELSEIRTYYYPAGHLTATQVGAHTLTSPVTGSSSTGHPTSCSLVASLRTDIPGRSGRGRIYWPMTSESISDTGLVAHGVADTLASAVSTLVTGLNAHTDTPNNVTSLKVVVASWTKGQTNDVTSVVVDTKPDHQSRRTDKIVADYSKTDTV